MKRVISYRRDVAYISCVFCPDGHEAQTRCVTVRARLTQPSSFTNILRKLINDEKPEYIAAVFDTDVPTFRHDRLPPIRQIREGDAR